MKPAEKLRIAISGELGGPGAGGVESVLLGLIRALGQLEDGAEEYVIIVCPEYQDWAEPYLGPNQRVVHRLSSAHQQSTAIASVKRGLGPLRPLVRRFWRNVVPPPVQSASFSPQVPLSDGFYESLQCDVMHFAFQNFQLCAMPTVFNPHDLQHLHYPQYFSPSDIAKREVIYQFGCHISRAVVVASQWAKDDFVQCHRLSSDKVQVIPWAPPTQAYEEPSPDRLAQVTAKYRLTIPFCLYPAATWEHKNHLRLFEALAILRERYGLVIQIVCTGRLHSKFWPRIAERIDTLRLRDQVQFLDWVPPVDLRAIYRLAQFVVVPSLFEAASAPVFEAWQEGTPVTCSNVTSLPEQAGGAALLFDPKSVEDIVDSMGQMAYSPDLRARLVVRGKARLNDFSWERTARAYRAVYRRAARRALNEEDRFLLGWDWMREPCRDTNGG